MYDTSHGWEFVPREPSPPKSPLFSNVPAEPGTPAKSRKVDQDGSATEGADPWINAQNGKSEHQNFLEQTGVVLKIFWNEVQVTHPKRVTRKKQRAPKRKKGDITTFSRKSRLRLLRIFNRLHLVCLGDPIFITLTARPECFQYRAQWLPEKYQDKPHNYIFRKEFLPMLQSIVPEAAYIWKMEPHKSGQAHYHLMVWSQKKARKLHSEYYKRRIRRLWRSCIDDDSRSAELYSCKIKDINSERRCFSYMTKYIMKEENHETAEIKGRRWGRSRDLPISPITEVAVSKTAYERIKEFAINHIKSRKSNAEDYIQHIEDGGDFFMWLDEETIMELLRKANRSAEASQYSRFKKTGSTDPPESEIQELRNAYGLYS